MSPEFHKKLDRAIDLYIQEMRDGCNECRRWGCCNEHQAAAANVITDPRHDEGFQRFLKEAGINLKVV